MARKGSHPTPMEEGSELAGRTAGSAWRFSSAHVSRRIMSERPHLNRLRLESQSPATGIAPIFHSPDSEVLSLCRVIGGPLLQLHFCPWVTWQRVATVRHQFCGPGQGQPW